VEWAGYLGARLSNYDLDCIASKDWMDRRLIGRNTGPVWCACAIGAAEGCDGHCLREVNGRKWDDAVSATFTGMLENDHRNGCPSYRPVRAATDIKMTNGPRGGGATAAARGAMVALSCSVSRPVGNESTHSGRVPSSD
jgi:hypothetical protein